MHSFFLSFTQHILLDACPWCHYESDTTERLHFHALKKEMATHSSVLAWRIPWTVEPGRLYSPRGCEESDTSERLHFHALEKEMATHSSVLAWRIPGTGEPGGLPSMGSQSQTRLK